MIYLGKKDRIIMAASTVCLVFCSFLIWDEDAYNYFFDDIGKSSQPEIGEIIQTSRDVRQRYLKDIVWRGTAEGRQVHVGDSIFTGSQSSGEIKMLAGEKIVLGDNTLVTFAEEKEQKVLNLNFGVVQVHLQGSMKISINGVLHELTAADSEIKITAKPGKKTDFKVVAGKARLRKMTGKKEERTITAESPAPASGPVPIAAEVPSAPTPALETPVVEEAAPPVVEFNHIFKDEDLYSRHGKSFRLRSPALTEFEDRLNIPVAGFGGQQSRWIQHSASEDFTNAPVNEIEGDTFEFKKVFLGPNFYRTSMDQQTWTAPRSFILHTGFIQDPSLAVETDSPVAIMHERIATLGLRIRSGEKFSSFLLENSTDPDFPPNRTLVSQIKNAGKTLRFEAPGVQYLRVRGVNEDRRLSETSPVVQVQVLLPEQPDAPRLTQEPMLVKKDGIATFEWHPAFMAQKYEVEVTDANGRIVATEQTTKPRFEWKPKSGGKFQLRVTAINHRSRRSVASASSFEVENPTPPPAPTPALLAAEKSLPAPSGSSALEIERRVPEYLNRNYLRSKLELEASTNRIQSSEQANQDQMAPVVASVGLRTHAWWGANGIEASVKSKVFSFNQAGQKSSALQLEGRFHRRFQLNWNPFASGTPSQSSVFLGYEMFRNSGSEYFAPKYDLMKTGITFDFPAAQRWDTGGEFVYGYGTDKSTKTEISGHFHFYVEKDWSLGAGYRVHLFNAGSEASTPQGMPYREGYGEAYSTLRWHY